MGFAKAGFKLEGEKDMVKGEALVDSGALYTTLNKGLAKKIGVKYTGLTPALTSFSGHKIVGREAVVKALTVERKKAPSELVVVCTIPEPVRKLLKRQEANNEIVVGVHTLERVGYAIDVVTHKLIESSGILMI